MANSILKGTRWVAAPLAGALAALVVQVAVYRATLELLGLTVRMQSGAWIWAAKAFTSPFMGCTFVVTVWWVVPGAKVRAAAVALGVVALWGGRLIAGGLGDNGSAWLVAMGTLGILGGMVAMWMARRTVRVTA